MAPRRLLIFGLAGLASLTLACGGGGKGKATEATPSPAAATARAQDSASVPTRFRALYDELDARLAQAQQAFPDFTGKSATVVGVELLPANGNAGASLLTPQAMATVRSYLDQLQRLGVKGVSVQISDPLLLPDFPRSAEYLAFYREVAAEVRRRGLLLFVETGPVFSGTDYSDVQVGNRWPTAQKYFSDRRQQLEIIVREIRPDYLSLGNEPDTERMLTRLSFGLDEYEAFLRDALAIKDRPASVRFGAGTGSWDDPRWVTAFATDLPLDFIDLHVYPLTNGTQDYLARTVELTRLAKRSGKEVAIGEAWLYKASAQEVQRKIAFADVYGRDYYSFWAPLDARFIDMMGNLARREGINYVSFFWSKYLFGYLAYDEATALRPPADLMRLSNRAAVDAMSRDEASPAGAALKRLASGSGER